MGFQWDMMSFQEQIQNNKVLSFHVLEGRVINLRKKGVFRKHSLHGENS